MEIRGHQDTAALLAAVAAAAGPLAVFLASSRPGGDAAAVSRVLAEADPALVGCVTWDNTCIPAAEDIFGALAAVLLIEEITATTGFLGLGSAWQYWLPGLLILVATALYSRTRAGSEAH